MRLIDADALIDILRKSHESHATNSREESLLDRDIRLVKEQAKYHPIIIEEPKQGEWIDTGEAIDDDIEVKCSLCGEELYWLANFCPNCGARMREGDEK